MKLEMLFIGALLFGLVFIAGFNLYAENLSTYSIDVDTNTTFGKLANEGKLLYDYNKDIQDKIAGQTVTDATAVDSMVSGGYTAIKNNPFNALAYASNTTQTLMLETDYVPVYMINFILIVLSILVTFAIIAIIFQFQQR